MINIVVKTVACMIKTTALIRRYLVADTLCLFMNKTLQTRNLSEQGGSKLHGVAPSLCHFTDPRKRVYLIDPYLT